MKKIDLDFNNAMKYMYEIKNDIKNKSDKIDMIYVNNNLYRISIEAYKLINENDCNGYLKLRLEQDLYYVAAEYIHEIELIHEQNEISSKKIRKAMCEMLDFYYDYIEENKDKVISHITECWEGMK